MIENCKLDMLKGIFIFVVIVCAYYCGVGDGRNQIRKEALDLNLAEVKPKEIVHWKQGEFKWKTK